MVGNTSVLPDPPDPRGKGIPAKDLDIADQILEPAKPQTKHGLVVNEGFRLITLGETGSGKTSLQRLVVYEAIRRGYAEFAVIHDVKGIFPEYPRSVQMPNVPTFESRGFQRGDIPAVSFRGDVRNDVVVTAEEVAGFSRRLLKQGVTRNGVWHPRPIVTVIEEVSEASTNGRKYISAPSVRWLAEQGRKVGGSLVGTTQSPRNIPLDLLEQASAIVFFRLTGGGANYLAERMKLNPRLIEAVSGPDGEGLPNFKFVIAIKGKPWDGLVHQLDIKTVQMFE
jgi:hypothetical protein